MKLLYQDDEWKYYWDDKALHLIHRYKNNNINQIAYADYMGSLSVNEIANYINSIIPITTNNDIRRGYINALQKYKELVFLK